MPRTKPVLVVLVLLAAALAAAGGGAAAAAAAPAYAPEKPWATGAEVQTAPRFDETWYYTTATWESDTDGGDVVVWDWGFSVLTTLPAGPGAQRSPSIDRGTVVYEDDRSGDWDIYLCESASYTNSTPPDPIDALVTGGAGDQRDPAISNNTVAFEDSRAGNWDIWTCNLTTHVTRRLTTSAADQVDPSIDDDQVVWADRRNGNWDIYLYDLTTGNLKQLTTNRAAQTAPQISGSKVVYQDHRNGNWDVYLYDLRRKRECRLTTEPHDQTAPQISLERIVVYQDDRHGAPDIYLHDLVSRTNRPVTDDPAAQTQPDVSGADVAWTDARTDAGDIYGCELGFPRFSFSAPSGQPRYGQTVTFHGTLDVPDGDESGLRVRVAGFGDPRLVPVSDADSDRAGTFSVTLKVRRKVTLRAAFAGDAGHLASQAEIRSVKPTALLTRPVIAKIHVPWPSNGLLPPFKIAVSGRLLPHHKSGTRAVTLVVQRQPFFGDWSVYRTVKVAVSNGLGGSIYRTTLTLPGGPNWRAYAVHADTDHARTQSAPSRAVTGLP